MSIPNNKVPRHTLRSLKSKPQGLKCSKSATSIWPNDEPSIRTPNNANQVTESIPNTSFNAIFERKLVTIPRQVLFSDFACLKPLTELNVKGWLLNKPFFETVHSHCLNVTLLNLDSCTGITLENFSLIRGLSELKKLSLQGIDCEISTDFAVIITSFPQLTYLNLSDTTTDTSVFKTLSLSCRQLKTIMLNKCKGLDEYGLYALSQMVQRFRTLEKISLTNSTDFNDLGLLDFIVNSNNILQSLSVSSCTSVSSLCLVGLRSKMNLLTALNISNMNISNSAFEWISEGCRELITLDLSQNSELDNLALIQIGHHCRRLKNVNISKCLAVSDEGVAGFNKKLFPGTLHTFDISGNILCGSDSAFGIAENCADLTCLKLNGLGKISAESLTVLFTTATKLTNFEMCCELAVTTLHRSSTVPHLNNAVLIHAQYNNITKIRLMGASMITDIGVVELLKKCGHILLLLDVSFCPLITNATLVAVARYCKRLESLILTGCQKINNPGIIALCDESSYFEVLALREVELMEWETKEVNKKGRYPFLHNSTSNSSISSYQQVYRPILDTPPPKVLATSNTKSQNTTPLPTPPTPVLLKRSRTASTASTLKHSNSVRSQRSADPYSIPFVTKHTHIFETLTELEMNGCCYITDESMGLIGRFSNLTNLGIRGCDQLTDKPVIQIAGSCTQLKSVDMMNLDLVTIDSVKSFVKHCINLTVLNAEGCSFTAREFSNIVRNVLPYATPVLGKCKLQPLHMSIVQFNRYIIALKEKDSHVYIIQRFCKYIIATKLRRLIQKLKQQKVNNLRRVFSALKQEIKHSKRQRKKYSAHENACNLQRAMRHMMAVYWARKKARILRRQAAARLAIQRVFRGHASRKRLQRRFRALYATYNRIGQMVHKYWVLVAARKLHKQILAVQAVGRMCIARQNYVFARRGIILFQRRCRIVGNFYRECHKEADRLHALRLLNETRDKCSHLLQRNWKATHFNRNMSSYILICCIWWRTDDDEKQWNSTILQRYWRGFIVRLRIWRAEQYETLAQKSAVKIQANYRRYYIVKQYLPWRDYKRYLYWKIKRILLKSHPKLRLGMVVKVLQRATRRYQFVCSRHRAAERIQRVFRGHYYRGIWDDLIHRERTRQVDKIKHVYHLYKCRRMRYAMFARRHMSAYKISMMVVKIFAGERARKQRVLQQKIERQEEFERKQNMLKNRRIKLVAKIRGNYQDRMACRIQRVFHDYKERKLEAFTFDNFSKTSNTLDNSITMLERKRTNLAKGIGLLNPVKAVGKLIDAVSDFMSPTELIHKRDEGKFINAVLKYQVKSILQEGIISLHLTMGELELKHFEHKQNQLKHATLPHYVKIEQDISGSLQLLMFLWVLHGTGVECICQLNIQEKPENMSNAAMKVRASDRLLKGIKITYHNHIKFEIQGGTVKQGNGEFAVQDIKVVTDPVEEERLTAGGIYSMVADLGKYGEWLLDELAV